jgi:hypothetical protein
MASSLVSMALFRWLHNRMAEAKATAKAEAGAKAPATLMATNKSQVTLNLSKGRVKPGESIEVTAAELSVLYQFLEVKK